MTSPIAATSVNQGKICRAAGKKKHVSIGCIQSVKLRVCCTLSILLRNVLFSFLKS